MEYKTAEEIKKRIKEIEDKLVKNDYRMQQLDTQQLTKKLLINSSYGSLSSRTNPIGDDDLANAITKMGSTSIQQVNVIAKDFVRERNPEASDYEIEHEVIVANDTDSSMISLKHCNVDMFDGDKVTPEGYKLVDEMSDYINTNFVNWFCKTTNSHNCVLDFKREKICDKGIYLLKKSGDEEAKKNYVLHILDNEGVTHPKFKYTGVKFARSVIPVELKKEGMKVIEEGIFSQDRKLTDDLVRDLYEKYKAMPLQERSTIQRIKGVEVYDNSGLPVGQYKLKTPAHVKAALNYNYLINKLNIKRLTPIKSGETAYIVHLEPNDFYFETIAFVDEWPKEFDQVLQIDHAKGFNKIIYDEIQRFYTTMGWPSYSPTANYEFSLLDILDINPG